MQPAQETAAGRQRRAGSEGGWLGGKLARRASASVAGSGAKVHWAHRSAMLARGIRLTMWNMVKKIGKVKPTRSEKTSLLKKLRPMFRVSHVTSTTAAAIEGCCGPEKGA